MLRIRPEQMNALAAASKSQFQARALEHLRRFFPARLDTLEGGGADLVRRTADRCMAAGIVAEADVVRVLDLLMVFGHAPEPPWMSEILSDPDRPGAARVGALMSRAMEERG